MEYWFAKQEMRLIQSRGISSCELASAAFRDFSRKIALILVSKGEFEIKTKDDKLWESYFIEDDPEMVQARNESLLRRQGNHHYSFIHKSFLEYFTVNGLLHIIENKNAGLKEATGFLPEIITQDQGVLSFIRDAFTLNAKLKEKCLNRIEESKSKLPKTKNNPQDTIRRLLQQLP